MALTNEQRATLLRKHLDAKGVHYNSTRRGWQKVSCYGAAHWHGDRNPSATINLTTGRYKCFACDLQGDAVALVMQEEGVDFQDALARLGANGLPQLEEPEWI